MIYITGDTHGDVTRFSMDNFPEQKTFTDQNENYVIICGDFGLVWNYLAETPSEKYWLKWLENHDFSHELAASLTLKKFSLMSPLDRLCMEISYYS